MAEDNAVRGQDGRFIRTAESAEKDAKTALLRSRGLGFAEIAKQLGYADEGGAYKAYRRGLAAIPVEAVNELRVTEAAKLDAMERAAWAALMRTYYLAQHGRIVVDAVGEPVTDSAPKLAAIDRLLKIQERRARLLGLDAPAKIDVRKSSDLDSEIESLLAQLDGRRSAEIEPEGVEEA